MSKTKYIAIASTFTGLTLLGAFIWHFSAPPNKQFAQKESNSVQGAYSEQQLSQSSDPNSISLSPGQPKANSSGGLSVAANSPANNLGQITPNTSGSSNPSDSGAAPKQNALDPATFAQYDKHKESNGALFGELMAGTGTELTAGKKAAVYYKGWLTNGQLFDMSRPDDKGELKPFIFEMGAQQVIPGWEQGLTGMKVGGSRLVIVPPAVGYGASGQGSIPGNAVLVFQVQLLAVE